MNRPSSIRSTFVVPVVCAIVAVAAAAIAVSSATSSPAEAQTVPASCSDTTSDAATIQNAIDGSHDGDEIVIHGPCLITKTIELSGGRSYRGDSRSTTIKAADDSNLPAVLASDSWLDDSDNTGGPIQLSNLTVDGNASNNAKGGDGIIVRSWQTTVQDITVQDTPRNGIRLTNLSRHKHTLQSTQVNGTMRNLFVTNSGANGIYVQDTQNAVTDWNLLDNWIASSKLDAIRSENGAGWVIEHNHVYDNGLVGISVERMFGTSITDNYVEDFTREAISVSAQGDIASTITSNRLFQFGKARGGAYLHIAKVNYGHGNVVVSNNAIYGNGSGTGLLYQRGNNPLKVVSTGNLVNSVATVEKAAVGVKVSAGS